MMKISPCNILVFFSMLVTLIGCCQGGLYVKTNGLYQVAVLPPLSDPERKDAGEQALRSDAPGKYYLYLRFYEDCTVVGASSIGEPEQVVRWLHPENQNVSVGSYRFKNDSLFLKLTGENGSVLYRGLQQKDGLLLSSESLINGHKADYFYRFVAVIPKKEPAE